jgi:thioredoxin-like negative regulator of GroEL
LRIAADCLPEIGNVRSSYAKALVAAGLNQEAVAQLDAVSEVYSDLNDRFLRLRLLGKITNDANIDGWQQLGKDFPALVTPHIELGTLYLNKGDKGAAIQEFLKVVGNKQDTKAAGLYREKARYMLEKINTSDESAVTQKDTPDGKD